MDAVKCPACGMESPEELGYCDFCKEPFRKKKPEAPPPPPKKSEVPVPPEVFAKLMQAKTQATPEGEKPGIPAEFAHLDAGERIERLPPWLRYFTWGFLAFIILVGLGAAGYVMIQAKRRKSDTHAPTYERHVIEPGPPQPVSDEPKTF